METQALLSKQNDKTVFKIVLAVSALICLVVVVLNQKLIPVPDTFPNFIYKLPLLNAVINGSCSVLLIASLWAIKKRNIQLHKKLNLTAFLLSSLFIISYVTAHYFIPDTEGPPFGTNSEELQRRFSPQFELLEEWVPRSYPNRTGLERMLWWRKKP